MNRPMILGLFLILCWFWSDFVQSASFERPQIRTVGGANNKRPTLCYEDADRGPCSYFRSIWYFDHRSGQCMKFVYGGCKGNANRFETQHSCYLMCAPNSYGNLVAMPPLIGATWTIICMQKPDDGQCPSDSDQQRMDQEEDEPQWSSLTLKSYFYNATSGMCEQFDFNGKCGGNTNRFSTLDDCTRACASVGIRWPVRDCYECDAASMVCMEEQEWLFSCTCRNGYHAVDGKCEDIDECGDEESRCDPSAWCVNTPGSYVCSCMAGYIGDGQLCWKATPYQSTTPTVSSTSIISSSMPPTTSTASTSSTSRTTLRTTYRNYTTSTEAYFTYHPWLPRTRDPYSCYPTCHANASCEYGKCKCKRGYEGDGIFCRDVDECARGLARCAKDAICRNLDGSYFCQCPRFYAGNGFFCTKTNRVCLKPFDPRYRKQCAEAKYQKRYYYDKSLKTCRAFWYDNCPGKSGNIFPDLETCQALCQRPNAPARYFETSTATTIRRGITVVATSTMSSDTAIDLLSPCRLPFQPGTCQGAYFMYYFNSTSRACAPFVYSGCGGNENRFLTRYSCEQLCVTPFNRPEQDCQQSVDYGYGRYDRSCQPFAGYAWFYDQDSERCGKFWYLGCGGNTNRFESEEECRAKCSGRLQRLRHQPKMMPFRNVRDCFLKKQPGHCYYMPNVPRIRFYYDYKDRDCKQFSYNGCGGNPNRFGSKEFCESTCQETHRPKSDLCVFWPDVGSCNNMRLMWYYDLKTGMCQSFFWSGCGGNLNRFKSRAECESICIEKPSDLCSLSRDAGPCKETHQRFYYDSQLAICRPFIYGGCEGNNNRFHSISECRLSCERYPTSAQGIRALTQSDAVLYRLHDDDNR